MAFKEGQRYPSLKEAHFLHQKWLSLAIDTTFTCVGNKEELSKLLHFGSSCHHVSRWHVKLYWLHQLTLRVSFPHGDSFPHSDRMAKTQGHLRPGFHFGLENILLQQNPTSEHCEKKMFQGHARNRGSWKWRGHNDCVSVSQSGRPSKVS